MKKTFVHENDGLDVWFELVNLAREGLDEIDVDNDEIAELVSEAKSALTHLEGEIRHIDGVEEPDIDGYVPDYQGNYSIARDVEIITYAVAKTFAPHADLGVFKALTDAFDTRKVPEFRTLEEINRFDEDD